MKINLHYRRDQKLPSQKGILTNPFEVDVLPLGDLPNSKDPSKTLPITLFKLQQMAALELYAFKGSIAEGSDYLLANIHLPNFLREMDANLTGIAGLFLVSLGDGIDNILDNTCKAIGKHGCPTRIVMGPLKAFSFNGMNFYPIMMRDFSIAFYICDADSKEYDWQKKHGTNFDKLFAVAVEYPIVFDATLGIYQTRGADLVPK
jgi:hypothetical protein